MTAINAAVGTKLHKILKIQATSKYNIENIPLTHPSALVHTYKFKSELDEYLLSTYKNEQKKLLIDVTKRHEQVIRCKQILNRRVLPPPPASWAPVFYFTNLDPRDFCRDSFYFTIVNNLWYYIYTQR